MKRLSDPGGPAVSRNRCWSKWWWKHRGAADAFLFIGALLLTPHVKASQLISRTLPELAAGADLIFVGRCESISCHWNQDHSLILTANRFRIARVLKGRPGETVTVDELGGTVGDDRLEVADLPRFTMAEEVLLYVHRTELGRWATFGAGQGKFEIVRDASGRPWVRSDFYRRELAEMSPTGRGMAPLAAFAGHLQAMLKAREGHR